jgi:hypothetical protein
MSRKQHSQPQPAPEPFPPELEEFVEAMIRLLAADYERREAQGAEKRASDDRPE